MVRCWVVGAMFPPSNFEDRWSIFRPSKIAVSTFEDRWSSVELWKIDNRCVHLRRSMVDVSTFDGRCVDLRRSMIDVSTFEDRWSMWNYVATLAQNIDTIASCMCRGFALQCFHYIRKNNYAHGRNNYIHQNTAITKLKPATNFLLLTAI